jgi:hypothetical protein
MSTRGWLTVKYATNVWIPCPPVFPAGDNADSWSALFAEQWWAMSGRKHGRREVKAMARMLVEIREYAYSHLEMHRGFIHLPDLALTPLLVSFGIWEAVGDRETQLRILTHADDPEAVQPPLVEEFGTEQLGPGLKTLSYTRKDDTVTGHLSYAWRSEEYATAVRMFTGSPDLGRLQRAVPDIEELARGAAVVPRP